MLCNPQLSCNPVVIPSAIPLSLHQVAQPGGNTLFSLLDDGALAAWDASDGRRLCVFPDGGPLALAPNAHSLALGSRTCGVSLLRLRGVPRLTPAATPVHLYDFRNQDWEGHASALCPECGLRLPLPVALLKRIDIWTDTSSLPAHPCLGMDARAFDDPALVAPCPQCRASIRISPFVANHIF
jgi:hypothetical protein